MTVSYHFEELQLPGLGEGMLLYGKAELVAGDERYPEEFVVEDIQIGDKRLPHAPRDGVGTFEQMLYAAIEKVIYDEKTIHGREAALEWDDFVSGEAPAVPMFKRRSGLDALVMGANLR